MATMTFFRQLRRDGGVRTGIDVGDDTVLSLFEGGEDDSDPTIEWYVDVRCQGAGLPGEAEAARRWLLRHGNAIQKVMLALADSIKAGIDPGDWPIRRDVRVGTVKVAVVCTAARRAAAQKMPGVLRDICNHWQDYLSNLLIPQFH